MPVDAADQPESSLKLETLLAVHQNVQEQIRFADTKAGFIAGINVLLVGFLAPHLDRLVGIDSTSVVAICVSSMLLTAYGMASVVSFGCVIACVVSRFGQDAPHCRIFCGHITATYGKDHGKYFEDVRTMSGDDWLRDVSDQIVENSSIASAKHGLVRWAAFSTAVALACWSGTVIALAAVAS
ncbi:Pycsar system effector family protein [Phycisphaerales bacterium AB-hyl4]|uniref:Pycsar system effector family protein n=1 Tax=Natronomicrosphaera hydrolytica TaxID=3242702 RepID=A0ABV4U1B6_9BACT